MQFYLGLNEAANKCHKPLIVYEAANQRVKEGENGIPKK